MPIFEFVIARDLPQYKHVRVKAETIEQAHEIACTEESRTEEGWDYVDSGNDSKPYVPCEDDYEIITGE